MLIKNVRVLNLDGLPDQTNEVFLPKGVTVEPEVPVTVQFGENKIGTAKLRIEGDAVFADLDLFLVPPLVDIWPAVGGEKVSRLRGDERWPTIIKTAHINQIGLCASPNADSRIEKLSFPLLPTVVEVAKSLPDEL
jgi:hypothetical protein